jgi:ankyrin repeat protein
MSKNDIFHHKTLQPNPKIKLNLKNALKSNNGKEFTTKVTDEVFKKCFDKYSGGPEVLKLINSQLENGSKSINNYINNMDISGFVDFYELREKETGNSYLHLAIEGNCPDLLKYFIEKGADINKQNKEGNTPLHLASKYKNMEIIGILLDKKAKLNIPNNEGEIPFDYFTSDMKKQFGLDKVLVINPRTNQ